MDLHSGEHTATDREVWQSLVQMDTMCLDNDLHHAAEDKHRLRKKRDIKKALTVPVATISHPCPHCPKICRSRIGLFAHLKFHKDINGE